MPLLPSPCFEPMRVDWAGSLIELGSANPVFFRPKRPYTELLVGTNSELGSTTERDLPCMVTGQMTPESQVVENVGEAG